MPTEHTKKMPMRLSRVVPRRSARDGAGRRPQVAFVLSGGGVLGAVQVGQLHALIEAGIVPDLLVGTSVGSINAAMIAAEPTLAGVEQMRAVWASLKSEDIFPGSRLQRAIHILRRIDHLYPNDGLRRLADRLPVKTFEQMSKSLLISATNLRTGHEHWFGSGPVAPAILASTALPGLFPPVAVDGNVFVDGGVVNNVPVSKAVSLGARKIYILTCGAKPLPRPVRGPLDVFMQAVTHSRVAAVENELARYSRDANIVVMPTFDTGSIRFNDPSHGARLMDQAYALSREFLHGSKASSRPPRLASSRVGLAAPTTA